jgi:hypothetical protein
MPRAAKALAKGLGECVLGFAEARGQGVYTTRSFAPGEVVMVDEGSTSGGLDGHANHSSEPTCTLRITGAGVRELVALRVIHAGAEVTVEHQLQSCEAPTSTR